MKELNNSDDFIFEMLKDRGLEENNYFVKCADGYIESVLHPYKD